MTNNSVASLMARITGLRPYHGEDAIAFQWARNYADKYGKPFAHGLQVAVEHLKRGELLPCPSGASATLGGVSDGDMRERIVALEAENLRLREVHAAWHKTFTLEISDAARDVAAKIIERLSQWKSKQRPDDTTLHVVLPTDVEPIASLVEIGIRQVTSETLK